MVYIAFLERVLNWVLKKAYWYLHLTYSIKTNGILEKYFQIIQIVSTVSSSLFSIQHRRIFYGSMKTKNEIVLQPSWCGSRKPRSFFLKEFKVVTDPHKYYLSRFKRKLFVKTSVVFLPPCLECNYFFYWLFGLLLNFFPCIFQSFFFVGDL